MSVSSIAPSTGDNWPRTRTAQTRRVVVITSRWSGRPMIRRGSSEHREGFDDVEQVAGSKLGRGGLVFRAALTGKLQLKLLEQVRRDSDDATCHDA